MHDIARMVNGTVLVNTARVKSSAPRERRLSVVHTNTVLAVSSGSVLVFAAIYFLPTILDVVSLDLVLVSAGIYVLSHFVRAIRLAMLAGPLLGVSGRTAIALHFATAPVALVLPFKLGELVRLQQLAVVGKSFPSAVVLVLLDRMFDAIFLVPIVLWVAAATAWHSVGTVVLLLTMASAIVPLIAVVLGPGMFGAVQDYIVLHHWNPRALRWLPTINALRQTLERGRDAIRGQWSQLALLSMVVWLSELIFVSLFMTGELIAELPSALLEKLNVVWVDFGSQVTGNAPGLVSLVGLLTLLTAWPMTLASYARRRPTEPLRPRHTRQSVVSA